MQVERYEKFWMWGAGVLIVLFLGAIGLLAAVQAVHPPSHLETVDPTALDTHPEFSAPAVATRTSSLPMRPPFPLWPRLTSRCASPTRGGP